MSDVALASGSALTGQVDSKARVVRALERRAAAKRRTVKVVGLAEHLVVRVLTI